MATEFLIGSEDARFGATLTLDEVDYVISFAWNTREARWTFDFAKADGTILVSGVPLVVDFPLLGRFASDDFPEGDLMLLDGSGKGLEAGRYDLGTRCKLLYLTAEELA